VTALARWRNLQLKEQGKLKVDRRPYSASEVRDVRAAEKWRNQVIREIAKKVTSIQNAGLGEFKLRDLNDEINKLLKEKSHWEDRIKELGGPDYKKTGPKLLDKEGQEVPGSRGYKYFGAAKNLPGVKDLFEAQVITTKKSKADMLREIDAEYYGYLDDEDYLLLEQEAKCEEEARNIKINEFKTQNINDQDMETDQNEEHIENLYNISDEVI
jgi:pre-mRNA-splicing factor ISY1